MRKDQHLSIRLTDDMHHSLKTHCLEERTTVQRVVFDLIADWLKQREAITKDAINANG